MAIDFLSLVDKSSSQKPFLSLEQKGDDPTVNSKAIPGDHGSSVVLLMVRDAYANYVVQTTLDVVPESEEKRLFLKELSSYADELVRSLRNRRNMHVRSKKNELTSPSFTAPIHVCQTYRR